MIRAVILLIVLGAATADAQTAQFGLRERPHAELPFELTLQIDGFEDSPAPDQPKLEIAGATVTPTGVTPNTSRAITIINGRQSIQTETLWKMTWRVTAPAGTIRVPAVTVKQGSKSATSKPADVRVEAIPTTNDMKVRLALPDRAVFVGETVPVKIEWLFRAEPDGNPAFAVPLASLDTFAVSAPPVAQGSRRVKIAAGDKELELPFELDETTVDGVEYNRIAATLYVAPRSAPPGGKLEVPPTSVVAALQIGQPDFFGRRSGRLLRAVDVARSLVVKPLPESDRPPTFAGAVGEKFSIEVRTSRSVVSLGEPVELEVTIKSDQRLDTLGLGKLDGPGRLPKDKFTAPAEPPTGELSADGKTKTFKVVAQVVGPATEIPAIDFAYFDPKTEKYRIEKSQPIALSIKGTSVVGASDVVVGNRKPATTQQPIEDSSLVNADLALSSPGAAEDTPLGGALLWVLVGILYAIPLGIFGFRTWQLRTAGAREEAGEVRTARKQVEALLDKAATSPAREIAGPLVAAMRELARVLGHDVDDRGLLAKLETEAFAPDVAGRPLSPDLRSDTAGLLRRWLADDRKARGGAKAAAAVVIAGLLLTGGDAAADALADGRAAYQYAMEQTGDATGRKAAFARAAAALGDAAAAHPDRPELLADWGNAALGAGELGVATLAYRRALALDPGNARARHNLAWLRGRLPDRMQPKAATGATDSLLFFHRWPRARRLLVGGLAFAVAILLVVPWGSRRRSGLLMLGALAAAVWLAMLASVLLEDKHADDAVVIDSVTLRAADSAGAPPALTEPLPRGVEVTIVERRDQWARIELANGTVGWVPDGAVERVIR